jgi:hypothetical protein
MDDLFQRRNPSLSRQKGSAQCRYTLRLIRSVGGVIGHDATSGNAIQLPPSHPLHHPECPRCQR